MQLRWFAKLLPFALIERLVLSYEPNIIVVGKQRFVAWSIGNKKSFFVMKPEDHLKVRKSGDAKKRERLEKESAKLKYRLSKIKGDLEFMGDHDE